MPRFLLLLPLLFISLTALPAQVIFDKTYGGPATHEDLGAAWVNADGTYGLLTVRAEAPGTLGYQLLDSLGYVLTTTAIERPRTQLFLPDRPLTHDRRKALLIKSRPTPAWNGNGGPWQTEVWLTDQLPSTDPAFVLPPPTLPAGDWRGVYPTTDGRFYAVQSSRSTVGVSLLNTTGSVIWQQQYQTNSSASSISHPRGFVLTDSSFVLTLRTGNRFAYYQFSPAGERLRGDALDGPYFINGAEAQRVIDNGETLQFFGVSFEDNNRLCLLSVDLSDTAAPADFRLLPTVGYLPAESGTLRLHTGGTQTRLSFSLVGGERCLSTYPEDWSVPDTTLYRGMRESNDDTALFGRPSGEIVLLTTTLYPPSGRRGITYRRGLPGGLPQSRWLEQPQPSGAEAVHLVRQLSDGTYLVLATRYGWPTYRDTWLLWLDARGRVLREQTLATPLHDVPVDAVEGSDGKLYVLTRAHDDIDREDPANLFVLSASGELLDRVATGVPYAEPPFPGVVLFAQPDGRLLWHHSPELLLRFDGETWTAVASESPDTRTSWISPGPDQRLLAFQRSATGYAWAYLRPDGTAAEQFPIPEGLLPEEIRTRAPFTHRGFHHLPYRPADSSNWEMLRFNSDLHYTDRLQIGKSLNTTTARLLPLPRGSYLLAQSRIFNYLDIGGRRVDYTYSPPGYTDFLLASTEHLVQVSTTDEGDVRVIKTVLRDPTALPDRLLRIAISLQPNPNDGQFVFTLPGEATGPLQYRISGPDGRVLQTGSGFKTPGLYSQLVLVSSNLPGTYWLSVYLNGELYTAPFVRR